MTLTHVERPGRGVLLPNVHDARKRAQDRRHQRARERAEALLVWWMVTWWGLGLATNDQGQRLLSDDQAELDEHRGQAPLP